MATREDNDTKSESQEVQVPTQDLDALRQENQQLMQENSQLRKDGQASKIIQGLSWFIDNNNQNQTQT